MTFTSPHGQSGGGRARPRSPALRNAASRAIFPTFAAPEPRNQPPRPPRKSPAENSEWCSPSLLHPPLAQALSPSPELLPNAPKQPPCVYSCLAVTRYSHSSRCAISKSHLTTPQWLRTQGKAKVFITSSETWVWAGSPLSRLALLAPLPASPRTQSCLFLGAFTLVQPSEQRLFPPTFASWVPPVIQVSMSPLWRRPPWREP